jgi:hypothetical protein
MFRAYTVETRAGSHVENCSGKQRLDWHTALPYQMKFIKFQLSQPTVVTTKSMFLYVDELPHNEHSSLWFNKRFV